MSTIKNNFNLYINIIGKSNIIIILLGLVGFNIFQVPNVFKSIAFSQNLLYTYSSLYYYLFLYIVCFFVINKIINNYNKKYYLRIRYENIEAYCRELFKAILICLGCVFILNFIISIIISSIDYGFDFSDSKYSYYSLNCSVYNLYYYFRLYIIIAIFSYMACKIFAKYRNNGSVWLFMAIFIASMFCVDNMVMNLNHNYLFKFFSAYYFNLYDYGSIINETLTFLFYQIVKIGIFNIIINLNLDINFQVIKNDFLYLITNKKSILFLGIYISINILNYVCSEEINYLLFSFNSEYNYYISVIMRLCSFSALICLLYSYIDYAKGYALHFIRTRISYRQHTVVKILICLFVVLLLRLPIYLIANNIYVIYDYIVYIVSIMVLLIFRHFKDI